MAAKINFGPDEEFIKNYQELKSSQKTFQIFQNGRLCHRTQPPEHYLRSFVYIYIRVFVNRLLYKVRIETPLALKCFNLVHLLVGNLDGGFYIKTVSQSGFKGTAAGKNLIFQI